MSKSKPIEVATYPPTGKSQLIIEERPQPGSRAEFALIVHLPAGLSFEIRGEDALRALARGLWAALPCDDFSGIGTVRASKMLAEQRLTVDELRRILAGEHKLNPDADPSDVERMATELLQLRNKR